MSLGKYILSMAIIALICWLVWGVVLYGIDPFQSGHLGLVSFYLTLFFALTTTFSVVGLVFRLWLVKQDLPVRQVATALRQGVLFSILIVGSLILLSLSILTWWNAILFIAVLGMLEFFFLSSKNKESGIKNQE